MKIGDRIKELRIESGFSQMQLAKLIGASQKAIDYWERNRDRFPKLYALSKKHLYAVATSCSSERLFSHASGFIPPKRSQLDPSHLEELCILHSWLSREGSSLFDKIQFHN